MKLEAIGIGRATQGCWLLNDISLSVYGGERLALVGPTGSGKTLLLRSLAFLDPLNQGEIRWHGETVRANDVPMFRSRVMYLQQRPALLEGTVEDNLRQPFSLGVHRDKKFDQLRVEQLLNSLGRNAEFLSKHQRDLSGGEAQLTALLRAVQLDPDILLLDEPTAALDADGTAMVETLVANWLDEQPDQRATMWVSHNDQQARRVSTSVLEIQDGRIKEP